MILSKQLLGTIIRNTSRASTSNTCFHMKALMKTELGCINKWKYSSMFVTKQYLLKRVLVNVYW